MRRFRLRRLWWVNCEVLRIAAGLNLKRLLKKRGWRGIVPKQQRPFLPSFWLLATGLPAFYGVVVFFLPDWFR